MFVVIAKKNHAQKFAPIGRIWPHTTAETAVTHAQNRFRFDGQIYIVVYDGKVIFTSI